MSNIHIAVSGADAAVTRPATLTAGMVGAAVTFSFSGEAWAALEKIAVFRAGNVRRDVTAWENGTCAIPWECLRTPGEHLLAGVYGDPHGVRRLRRDPAGRRPHRRPCRRSRHAVFHPHAGACPGGGQGLRPV